MFIAIEGLDGAGKSTMIPAIVDKLSKDYPDHQIIVTFEPGASTEGSAAIRNVLKTVPLDDDMRTALFCVARTENVRHGDISRYLKCIEDGQKAILISDRYDASTAVYQKLDTNQTARHIYGYFANAFEFPNPDVYVFLSVSFEESKRRRLKDLNRPDADKDVLEAQIGTEERFAKVSSDYANFFDIRTRLSGTPTITVDTSSLTESEQLEIVWEKLNAYITERIGSESHV